MIKFKIILSVFFACFLFSCNSNKNEKVKTPPEKEVIDTVTTNNSNDSQRVIINRSMIWTVQQQGIEKEKLKAPDSTKIKNFSSAQLIDLLNQNYPGTHLDFIKVSNDTIYVKIPDSKNSINQIGDTGAENYLASTVFTLTEMKNIKFVNIEMTDGSHAEPGVYSRDDFKSLR